MPKASVPAVVPKKPAPVVLSEEHQKGYSFVNDRWEDDEHFLQAVQAATYWKSKGWNANVHEDISKGYNFQKQKQGDTIWFRVYFLHPQYKDLYAWWTPSLKEWLDEPKVDELTWFELKKPDPKK